MNWQKIVVLFIFLAAAACSRSSGGSSDDGNPDGKVTPWAQFCKDMSFPSGHQLHYCVRPQNPAATVPSLLYFFHGLGGNSEDIFTGQFDTTYQDLVKQFGASTPFVIGLSFGTAELLPLEVGSLDPVSIHELTDIAMPQIERDLGFDTNHIPVRNLMGFSLGGFNALNFAAAREASFKSVAALCPALIDFDPFDDKQVAQYMSRNADVVNRDMVNQALGLLRAKYSGPAVWTMSDPLSEIQLGKLASLPVFLSTGAQDEYGFFEGAQRFAQMAKPLNPGLTWAPTEGKHCSYDEAKLLEFLAANIPHK